MAKKRKEIVTWNALKSFWGVDQEGWNTFAEYLGSTPEELEKIEPAKIAQKNPDDFERALRWASYNARTLGQEKRKSWMKSELGVKVW